MIPLKYIFNFSINLFLHFLYRYENILQGIPFSNYMLKNKRKIKLFKYILFKTNKV